MGRRRGPWIDAAVYGGSVAATAVLLAVERIPLQLDWARAAVGPYTAAFLLALAVALSRRGGTVVRGALAASVFIAVTAVPLAGKVTARLEGRPSAVQSETLLTEQAAGALLRGENPYAVSYRDGPLAAWPPSAWLYLPYLPGVMAFGLPRAVLGPGPFTDARVLLGLVALAAAAAAATLSRAPPGRWIPALLFLFVLPTGPRDQIGGGDDVVVLSLMLLSLTLVERRSPRSAGVALGVAAAIKQTAWPLVPFAAAAARFPSGRPAATRFLAASAMIVAVTAAPFLAWDPGAFVRDTVLYPMGLGTHPTLAGDRTLGRWLIETFPAARGALLVLLPAAVLATGAVLLLRRRPTSAQAAARHTAVLLILAILLATAGRFGYLMYPINLLAWGWLVLRRAPRDREPDTISPPSPARTRLLDRSPDGSATSSARLTGGPCRRAAGTTAWASSTSRAGSSPSTGPRSRTPSTGGAAPGWPWSPASCAPTATGGTWPPPWPETTA
ncbi:MAG TPA: glycosyltransferase 87 family protein [Actinomycetota bacterium]|nr:glycosyltransferase 87 family protein [Actinomycetota bacterium]